MVLTVDAEQQRNPGSAQLRDHVGRRRQIPARVFDLGVRRTQGAEVLAAADHDDGQPVGPQTRLGIEGQQYAVGAGQAGIDHEHRHAAKARGVQSNRSPVRLIHGVGGQRPHRWHRRRAALGHRRHRDKAQAPGRDGSQNGSRGLVVHEVHCGITKFLTLAFSAELKPVNMPGCVPVDSASACVRAPLPSLEARWTA